jgi:hypothetical protein
LFDFGIRELRFAPFEAEILLPSAKDCSGKPNPQGNALRNELLMLQWK